MQWHRRGNSGGSWLPEDKKANMWRGRGIRGGSWPPAFPRSLEYLNMTKFAKAPCSLQCSPAVINQFLIMTCNDDRTDWLKTRKKPRGGNSNINGIRFLQHAESKLEILKLFVKINIIIKTKKTI